MDSLIELVRKLRDIEGLITWGGTVGLTAIIFAETGLLIFFFLPGDSLLVTAGLLAATHGLFDIVQLGLLLTAASIAGNMVAYHFGRATGPRLFSRENSLLFNRKHLQRAQDFYERHGGKTVIIARFMPIVRTFVPIVAGMGQMEYRRFVFFNVVGGVLWIWSMLLTGYFLGRYIPGVAKHIELVIIVVIALSLLPGVIGWWRSRSATTKPAASDA
jgi:membrane-associated protein